MGAYGTERKLICLAIYGYDRVKDGRIRVTRLITQRREPANPLNGVHLAREYGFGHRQELFPYRWSEVSHS